MLKQSLTYTGFSGQHVPLRTAFSRDAFTPYESSISYFGFSVQLLDNSCAGQEKQSENHHFGVITFPQRAKKNQLDIQDSVVIHHGYDISSLSACPTAAGMGTSQIEATFRSCGHSTNTAGRQRPHCHCNSVSGEGHSQVGTILSSAHLMHDLLNKLTLGGVSTDPSSAKCCSKLQQHKFQLERLQYSLFTVS